MKINLGVISLLIAVGFLITPSKCLDTGHNNNEDDKISDGDKISKEIVKDYHNEAVQKQHKRNKKCLESSTQPEPLLCYDAQENDENSWCKPCSKVDHSYSELEFKLRLQRNNDCQKWSDYQKYYDEDDEKGYCSSCLQCSENSFCSITCEDGKQMKSFKSTKQKLEDVSRTVEELKCHLNSKYKKYYNTKKNECVSCQDCDGDYCKNICEVGKGTIHSNAHGLWVAIVILYVAVIFCFLWIFFPEKMKKICGCFEKCKTGEEDKKDPEKENGILEEQTPLTESKTFHDQDSVQQEKQKAPGGERTFGGTRNRRDT